MITSKRLPTNGVQDWVIDFGSAGDVFGVHDHGEADTHVTVVARGRFKCLGDPMIAGKELETGDVVEWPVGFAHGFEALTDNARLVNVSRARP